MISVILAGGKGLRLWPESRQSHPKQLCKFVGNRSMLDHTIDRLIKVGSRRIIIITSDDLMSSVQSLVQKRPDAELIDILGEPVGKNTAPAVGMALAQCLNETDEVMGIFPADHHILDVQAFEESVQRAIQAAQQGCVATIGITPNRPETGYGYIEKTKWEIASLDNVYQVNSFCEKPDLNIAQNYINSGSHMWNAGIYIAQTRTLLEEFARYLPDIYENILKGPDGYLSSYAHLPEISLDYGIAERSHRMAVVPANFGWCDLGSWNALEDLYDLDEYRNVICGDDVVALDSRNCLIKQSDKSIVLFGVDHLLVVETGDVIFITERSRAQDVRSVVETLHQLNRQDLL
ncbi:MAG: NTP transferase domain-containing protein [Syntrophomonadaceae bacterium]|jgi:mannose-1-phosphate guanylyltransferase/mannose-6-phosphate isomerase|nr:sugar phosphate nucleotidyltransferase [Bacillota bacterium]NLM88318.1 NTP transferase domain-containing protein [Syntrophomonadaceae bacterium]HQA51041.1 sugar phosphate nucleotidyltransferase [Syntrophomonadaceae bacterium]HQD91422.1 sugar phosphate nucleotidyltransferase [Syntrophomonadaceae bacterium]